jgi:hypothetical protein
MNSLKERADRPIRISPISTSARRTEHIILPCSTPVHAELATLFLDAYRLHKLMRGELAALVGIHNLRLAMRLDASCTTSTAWQASSHMRSELLP